MTTPNASNDELLEYIASLEGRINRFEAARAISDSTKTPKNTRRQTTIMHILIYSTLTFTIIGMLMSSNAMKLNVNTQRLTIRDPSGVERAFMGTDPDGRVFLSLLDGKGTPRMQVRADDHGSPDIAMFDGNDHPRFQLSEHDNGALLFNFFDAKGKGRVAFGIDKNHNPMLQFNDETMENYIKINQNQGSMNLAFVHGGVPRLRLGVDRANATVITLLGRDNRPRITIADRPNGPAGIIIQGGAEGKYVELTIDGNDSIRFRGRVQNEEVEFLPNADIKK